MTSREELLALAAQLDAEGASQHVRFQDADADVSEPASDAGQRRQRATELVKANEAARLLGLILSTSSSTSAAAASPPWPRSELPVLPPPRALKRTAPMPKVTRSVRNGVIARLAGEHALLLAAAAAATPSNDSSASASASASTLTALLVEIVISSPSLRRAATSLALKQEESAVYNPSTGKDTYLARARATTALGARMSAAEVQAALQVAKTRKGRGDDSDDEEGGDENGNKKKRRKAAPCPNPTPLPLLRKEQKEKEKKEEEEERQALQPLPLEEEEIDWKAAGEQEDARPQPALPSPRSAISAVVSAALAPFVENKQVSKETAEATAERAISKVLGSFLVSPLAAKAEKRGKLNAAVAAFLTDSQRGKIAEFARKCLDAEERRRR